MKNIRIILLILLISFPVNIHAQEVTPWDPYKMISKIVNDLQEICKANNISTIVDNIPLDRNKTPTDVYEKAYLLLEKMHALVNSKRYAAGNDKMATLPPQKKGRMIPADVLEVLMAVSNIADIIKQKEGIRQDSEIVPEPGITPPYVYQKTIKAIALVDKLL